MITRRLFCAAAPAVVAYRSIMPVRMSPGLLDCLDPKVWAFVPHDPQYAPRKLVPVEPLDQIAPFPDSRPWILGSYHRVRTSAVPESAQPLATNVMLEADLEWLSYLYPESMLKGGVQGFLINDRCAHLRACKCPAHSWVGATVEGEKT